VAHVPIVPSAILFDLGVGDASIRPDAAAGYQACKTASTDAPEEGNVGAGAAPRTSTPPIAPASAMMTVQPVGRRVSV
jgi:L-aminopeptidase/D-esterase-like protein